MAKVRSISVVYQAFTDQFEKATDRATGKMKSFVKKAATIGAGFVVANASIGKFTAQFEKFNQLKKQSDQLGVDPTFLRTITKAVENLGGSAENAEDIIREFNIRLGEAKLGAGPLVDAFKQLGLSVEDFKNLSPEESLTKFIDELGKLDDQQKKLFLAGEGAGGPLEDFIGLTDLGAEGIAKLRKEIEKTQGPLSTEDLQRINDANIAIDRMWDSLDGIFNQILIAFAPALQEIAEWFGKILQKITAIATKWKEWQKDLEDALAFLIGGEAAVNTDIGEDAARRGGGDTVGGIDGAIKDLDAAFGDIDEITKDLFKDLEKFKETSTKSFSDAIAAQSSKAFDILNPNRSNSVQSQILEQNKMIEQNTAVVADALQNGDAALIQMDIPG